MLWMSVFHLFESAIHDLQLLFAEVGVFAEFVETLGLVACAGWHLELVQRVIWKPVKMLKNNLLNFDQYRNKLYVLFSRRMSGGWSTFCEWNCIRSKRSRSKVRGQNITKDVGQNGGKGPLWKKHMKQIYYFRATLKAFFQSRMKKKTLFNILFLITVNSLHT